MHAARREEELNMRRDRILAEGFERVGLMENTFVKCPYGPAKYEVLTRVCYPVSLFSSLFDHVLNFVWNFLTLHRVDRFEQGTIREGVFFTYDTVMFHYRKYDINVIVVRVVGTSIYLSSHYPTNVTVVR